MSTQISEDIVNTVKERLKGFLEYIITYSVDRTQPDFYRCIRSCVVLFWQRKTYDYGTNDSGETWPNQKPMSHEEAIQKIKEKVIPLLKTAQSLAQKFNQKWLCPTFPAVMQRHRSSLPRKADRPTRSVRVKPSKNARLA